MATNIPEVTKKMAKHLLHLISQISEDLKMMEVTDHFDLMKELGSGSNGKAFLAKHRHLGQNVALKLLTKERTPMDNFLLEYSTSLTLSCNPHIIMTHEIALYTRSDYVFVQEVATAGTLQSIIKPKVGLQEDIVKRCCLQIASALDFMHSRGLVHRDIKVDNIILMDTECYLLKVSDFGFTRLQAYEVRRYRRPWEETLYAGVFPVVGSMRMSSHLYAAMEESGKPLYQAINCSFAHKSNLITYQRGHTGIVSIKFSLIFEKIISLLNLKSVISRSIK